MPDMILRTLAAASILALAACSGGGGSDEASIPPAPIANAEGLWGGTNSDSRSVRTIVLDDGTYWLMYSIPNLSSVLAGVVQGKGTALNGSFSSADGVDFNVEGAGAHSATLSASYVTKQSFNGTVTNTFLNQVATFTSSYNAEYELTPSVSAITGTYTGIASVTGSNEVTTIIVSSPGVIAGTGTGGCRFVGTVRPRARGNVYDVSMAFGGGACPSGTSTVAGIGFFDSGSKRFYMAALNSAKTDGLLFLGQKL